MAGFCYGGAMANMHATRVPDLGAAVPFDSTQPPAADVPKIKAPLLIQYAENDERVNAGWPAYEAALKASKATYTARLSGHAARVQQRHDAGYDEKAAELAWQRTVDFFSHNPRK